MLQELNKELLISLNSMLDYNIIKNITLYFADLPIFFLPIFLLSFWIYYSYSHKSKIISNIHLTNNLLEKENLLYIFYSVVLWITISLWIQQIIQIDRPEEALKWVWELLLNHIPDASFPSDHATVAVAFLSSIYFSWYKKIWYIFTPFVIIMLLSRVILWVHWPLDIIVWALVWLFSSLVTFKYITKIKLINKMNQFIIKLMSYIKL
jgi:membrane-associated phospholipid phosphatase